MSSKTMKFNLKIWRQAGPNAAGKLVDYVVEDVIPEMSFLEMLDVLNEQLAANVLDKDTTTRPSTKPNIQPPPIVRTLPGNSSTVARI